MHGQEASGLSRGYERQIREAVAEAGQNSGVSTRSAKVHISIQRWVYTSQTNSLVFKPHSDRTSHLPCCCPEMPAPTTVPGQRVYM